MKKRTLLLALTALIACTAYGEKLKVMTFNVRCVVESDGLNQWKNRKDYAADLVKFYHPDIWGAQEATHQQMTDLQERLPEYAYVGVGRDDGKTKGEYSPIFYRKDRFEPVESGFFWLAEKEKMHTPGVLGWDAAYPRVATWCIFRDKQSGEKFFFLNTHLDNEGVKARHNGADLLLQQTADLSQGLPSLMTGDFNAVPDDEPIKVITDKADSRSFVHSRDIAELAYGPDWTFHDFGRIPYGERQWLDYIFVKGDWKVVYNASLTDYMGDLFPSDHCPVIALLEF